ncbi:MAG: FAD-binding oxidoreductase [Deltaproteobacteria bacterium]|nr:MAG: FAD-binding oxidoreductase [Deltaproteobacteria bacterium]
MVPSHREPRWDPSIVDEARARGIVVATPSAEDVARGFPESPAHDFGKFIERVPGAVLRPDSQEQLDVCVALLAGHGVPFKVRGAGHCSGGQTLIADGAVLDLRDLCWVVEDRPDEDALVVEAAATWLEVCEYLREAGRSPSNLTMNWRTTVAGSLMTGGFGDASHHEGPQINMVRGLELLTLDGTRHQVGPGDPLFDYTLAGRGQLGVVTQVTLATVPRVWSIVARSYTWQSIEDYLHDLPILTRELRCDVVRTRISWTRGRVLGAAGYNSADLSAAPPDYGFRGRAGEAQVIDLFAAGGEGPNDHWLPACPALELILPYAPEDPAGSAALLEELRRQVVDAGLATYTPIGSAIMSLPPASVAPHAPLAPLLSGPSHVVVLRPEVPVAKVPALLPALEAIGRWCYAQGGKHYLVGIEPPGLLDLERQFGPALAPFRRLKAQWDPNGLLNPGLLD